MPADAAVPDWAWSSVLVSVTRTRQELSIVAPSAQVPAGVMREDGFRALVVRGPLAFSMTGVLAELSGALADAAVPIFVVSTYETDVILVRESDLAVARSALQARGHRVV